MSVVTTSWASMEVIVAILAQTIVGCLAQQQKAHGNSNISLRRHLALLLFLLCSITSIRSTRRCMLASHGDFKVYKPLSKLASVSSAQKPKLESPSKARTGQRAWYWPIIFPSASKPVRTSPSFCAQGMKTRRCAVSAISGTHHWANPSASIGLCALRLTTCSVSCTTRSVSSLPHTGRKPPNWPSHATWCSTSHGNFNWLIRHFEWYCLNRRKLPNILYIWIITHKCTVMNSSFLYHAGRLYHHKCLREEYKGNNEVTDKKIASIQKNINSRPGIN